MRAIILDQIKDREQKEEELNYDNKFRPHIQGDKGYPQLPQLTSDQVAEVKKSNQQFVKSNLLQQIAHK